MSETDVWSFHGGEDSYCSRQGFVPCNVVGAYSHFKGTFYLHLEDGIENEGSVIHTWLIQTLYWSNDAHLFNLDKYTGCVLRICLIWTNILIVLCTFVWFGWMYWLCIEHLFDLGKYTGCMMHICLIWSNILAVCCTFVWSGQIYWLYYAH
jgi:hypothetical protein